MRRRRLLTVGLAGLVASAAGCGGRSGSGGGSGAGRAPGAPTSAAPTYDPASYPPPAIAVETLRKLYPYDQKAFLDVELAGTREESGVRVEDLTFTGATGVTVPATVLSPEPERGRVPGVVIAADAGPDPILPQALELVRLGMVAAVTSVAFSPSGDPTADSTTLVNAVIAQRRALDLLTRRDDTDPTRFAMVGFGWGGALAQIVAGVDSRPVTVVSAGCGGRWSRTATRMARPADPVAYLDALTRFDGVRYLAAGGRRSVLLQFGAHDEQVPAAEADELVAATTGTKARKDYDAGHELATLPAAVADRRDHLRRVLRLK